MGYKKPVQDIIQDVYDEANKRLRTDTQLTVGDIEVGAVELKDADTDNRAHVDNQGRIHVYDEASSGASTPTSLQPKTYTVGTSVTQMNGAVSKNVMITVDPNNTGNVFLTDSSDSDRFPLEKGNNYVFDIANTNAVYFIADANNQTVYTVTGEI